MLLKINQLCRTRAFYLLKKYTSYRLLKEAYFLDEKFVNAFERQLRQPSSKILKKITEYDQERYEKEYLMHLYILKNKEKGLDTLLKSTYKNEAYSYFFEDGGIKGTIFGRYGDEQGLVEDIFYQELGMGQTHGFLYAPYDHSSYILKILISNEIGGLAVTTLLDGEYVIPNKHKIYNKWSYESLFSEDYWPLMREIVERVENCPDYNLSPLDEILSGAEIVISGIYEPWFKKPVYEKLTLDQNYNPYVGCPNYFLNGAIATKYKLEGTDEWVDVKWRLIWEDKRYLDGSMPEEEKTYIFNIENIGKKSVHTYMNSIEKLSIGAGQVCPKTGYWFTVAQENSRQYFKQGEILPEIKSDWGEVYWQFDGV